MDYTRLSKGTRLYTTDAKTYDTTWEYVERKASYKGWVLVKTVWGEETPLTRPHPVGTVSYSWEKEEEFVDSPLRATLTER